MDTDSIYILLSGRTFEESIINDELRDEFNSRDSQYSKWEFLADVHDTPRAKKETRPFQRGVPGQRADLCRRQNEGQEANGRPMGGGCHFFFTIFMFEGAWA